MLGVIDPVDGPDRFNAMMCKLDLAMGGVAVAMGLLALLGTYWVTHRYRTGSSTRNDLDPTRKHPNRSAE